LQRTTKWAVVFGAIILLGVLVASWGQGEQTTQPQVISVAEQARRARADVNALLIVRRLGLTSQQLEQIIPLLEAVQEQHGSAVATLDLLWDQNKAAIEGVINDWLAGRTPTLGASQAADQAATQAQQLDSQLQTAVTSCVGSIGTMLTPEQLALIETPAQYEQRMRTQRQLQGASSVAEFIVWELDAQRELMPDEYNVVRRYKAQEIATLISAPNAPQFEPVVAAVLNLMDTTMAWSDPQYAQQRPTLADQVAQFLNLPLPLGEQLITYDALMECIKSPRSAQVLQELRGAEFTQQPAAWPQHTLLQAIARSNVVALLNSLQLNLNQLALLLPLASQGQNVTQTGHTKMDNLVVQARPNLATLRASLLIGSEMDAAMLAQVVELNKQLREIELDTKADMGKVIDELEDILYPVQAELIDWRQPPEVLGRQDPALRAAAEKERAATVAAVLDFLDSMRYVVEPMFTQRLQGRCDELASQYFNPESPDYPQIIAYLMRATRQMKTIGAEDWEQGAVEFAADVAIELGILEPAEGRPGGPKPITWERLYQMLSNPDTPELVQKMIEARTPEQEEG